MVEIAQQEVGVEVDNGGRGLEGRSDDLRGLVQSWRNGIYAEGPRGLLLGAEKDSGHGLR